MAERRMFAKTIIDSDAFLDMPLSSQCLYFHLAMRADDDGFINNPKKIQRMIGASDDDLKLLAVKRFLIPFDSGVVVIKHWKIHNYIQNDRYKPTIYQEEKKLLTIKDNNSYTECIHDVSKMETQVRLGKDSIGKVSIGQSISPDGEAAEKTTLDVRFDEFWMKYPKKVGKGDARKSWKRIKPDKDLFSKIMESLDKAKNCDQWKREKGRFIPNPSTWLNQERWEDEVSISGQASYEINEQEVW